MDQTHAATFLLERMKPYLRNPEILEQSYLRNTVGLHIAASFKQARDPVPESPERSPIAELLHEKISQLYAQGLLQFKTPPEELGGDSEWQTLLISTIAEYVRPGAMTGVDNVNLANPEAHFQRTLKEYNRQQAKGKGHSDDDPPLLGR